MPGINFDHPGSDIVAGSGTMKIDGAAAFTAADKIALDAAGVDQVARNNIMLNAFRIAINGGLSVLNMEDGLVDEFEDETGVDTGASTDEVYDSGADLYANQASVSAFSAVLDTNLLGTEDKSFRVVLEASVITQSANVCKVTFEAASIEGFEIDLCYIGEKAASGDEWDMKVSPAPVKVTFSSSDGFSIGSGATIESDVIDFVIDSSKAYVIAFDVGSNASADGIRVLSVVAGAESYLKSGANEAHLADVTGYAATWDIVGIINLEVGNPDMVLQSNAFTAVTPSDPTEARIVVFEEDVDAVTLNTDLKAYASRDGTTFTQITLADEGDYESGKQILTGSVDISGQPAGTSMKWKLTTHNTKRLKVHGVALQWS